MALRQEDHELESSLGQTKRHFLKTTKQTSTNSLQAPDVACVLLLVSSFLVLPHSSVSNLKTLECLELRRLHISIRLKLNDSLL